jgi:predicted amidophosphoribosyltransferase
MEVSQCCAASIIFSDICSHCQDHTGIIYLCEQCEEEIDEYADDKTYCDKCNKELDQNADSE